MEANSSSLENQIGGHRDIFSIREGGSILAKSMLSYSKELACWKLFTEVNGANDYLPYFPLYYGLDVQGEKTFLLMENLAYGYLRPCVLDIKIGTKVCAPDSSEKKKVGQTIRVGKSTGPYFGARITGFNRFDPDLSPNAISATREYMLSFKSEQGFLETLQIYFSKKSPNKQKTEEETGKKENIILTTYSPSLLSSLSSSSSLRSDVVVAVRKKLIELEIFLEKKEKDAIEAALKQHKDGKTNGNNKCYAFYSTSLLIIYEGDAEGAIKLGKEKLEKINNTSSSSSSSSSSSYSSPFPKPPQVKLIDLQHVFEKVPKPGNFLSTSSFYGKEKEKEKEREREDVEGVVSMGSELAQMDSSILKGDEEKYLKENDERWIILDVIGEKEKISEKGEEGKDNVGEKNEGNKEGKKKIYVYEEDDGVLFGVRNVIKLLDKLLLKGK